MKSLNGEGLPVLPNLSSDMPISAATVHYDFGNKQLDDAVHDGFTTHQNTGTPPNYVPQMKELSDVAN